MRLCARAAVTCLLACLFVFVIGSSALHAEDLLRIRVDNRIGGLIEVSSDGHGYDAIGKVLRPATASIEGFTAAAYLVSGRVAAMAVHGIRMKVGELDPKKSWEKRKPLMISLVPFEFATIPKGFGGHVPHESGIYTDIPTGKTIFRNLAPYVGNKVYLQTNAGLNPIPDGYTPSVGDVLVIVVSRPDKPVREIDFENKVGGKVTAVYADGRMDTVTTVTKPVEGVGRYDGTSYTGRGRINTNHPGVLTVSTAPVSPTGKEGVGAEDRGGFQIIPSYHAQFQPEITPQIMVVGPAKPTGPIVEGKSPLFAECFGLTWDPLSDKHSFVAQVRIDDGGWESVPEILGKVDNALTAAGLNEYYRSKGVVRDVRKGVTQIRILFPTDDRAFLTAEIQRAVGAYTAARTPVGEPAGKAKEISGNYLVSNPLGYLPSDSVVSFFIDGQVKKISAAYPHQFEWNSKTAKDGEHIMDIRATDPGGSIIRTATVRLLVKNGQETHSEATSASGVR